MMNDYEILKFLGLEIKEQHLIFYDDDSNENIIEFNDIDEIWIEEASEPIENKVRFWLEKIFVIRSIGSIIDTKTNTPDYRNIYELEIQLTDKRVLSRKIQDANIFECQELIKELNKAIRPIISSDYIQANNDNLK
nr:hypothetical protein [uncultured Carboxylicivirga sp.]